MDSSAGGLLEGMGLDGDTLAPMETDEPSAADPKTKSKLTPAMATRIKQIKPLLSGRSMSKAHILYFCVCKCFSFSFILQYFNTFFSLFFFWKVKVCLTYPHVSLQLHLG